MKPPTEKPTHLDEAPRTVILEKVASSSAYFPEGIFAVARKNLTFDKTLDFYQGLFIGLVYAIARPSKSELFPYATLIAEHILKQQKNDQHEPQTPTKL